MKLGSTRAHTRRLRPSNRYWPLRVSRSPSRKAAHCDLTYAPSGLSIVVTARCHGSTETAELTLADVMAADTITIGDAFTAPEPAKRQQLARFLQTRP